MHDNETLVKKTMDLLREKCKTYLKDASIDFIKKYHREPTHNELRKMQMNFISKMNSAISKTETYVKKMVEDENV